MRLKMLELVLDIVLYLRALLNVYNVIELKAKTTKIYVLGVYIFM